MAHASALNMNDTVFVDCAMAWDTDALFGLYPSLGFTRDGLAHRPKQGDDPSPEAFLAAQQEAWDFVRGRIDRGIPCYGWELAHIPMYYVINGYDDVGYYWSAHMEGGPCPWDKMGTFDVRHVSVHSIEPCPAAADDVVVRDALTWLLERIERPDGWTINPQRYRTGLPAYEMWAEALATGRAILGDHGYINHFWLECREMAVEFLREAKGRLAGRCDAAFDEAAAHYAVVRDRLRALLEMHPEREGKELDWTTTFQSADGAALVRDAAEAETQGVACLRRIAEAL